jgi:molybdopterin molybdotransferase
VAPGEHVIQIGEDIGPGDLLLDAGRELRPQDIGGLLAVGIVEVTVAARLRVGIISGGDEIVSPDTDPGPGQIRDINSYTIAALVERAGHTPVLMGIVPDQYEALERAARDGLAEVDVLILSAGSSVSTRDMTAAVIGELGRPGVLVHGVAIHPGKPTILAMAGGKPVFGLPGNPVSTMVAFELFVTPTLSRLLGCEQSPGSRVVQARLARNVASHSGREDFVPARLETRDGLLWAEPVFGKSNLIYTMAHADGMLHVPLDLAGLYAGDQVMVRLF